MNQQQKERKLKLQLEKNELANSSFAIALTSEGLANMIHSACSDIWSKGQSHLVVQELMRKYQPVNTISRV